ncbi:MAG: hypothetical protein ACLQVG_04450 [Terriglobia bacterium]
MRSSYRPLSVLLATLLLAIPSFHSNASGATPPPPASPKAADKPVPRSPVPPSSTLAIPGPLLPFLRLAAVSRKADPEEVLPLLSHQVVLDGFGGATHASSASEYLVLVRRYVDQARELQTLAGPDGNIRVSNCSDAARLLNVIGYKLQQPCGPQATLETANPKRAFTTVDSGFPLAELEKAFQTGKPFVYPFSSTQLPVLFDASVWMENDRNKNHKDLLDALLGDPDLPRLYWALAQIDEETRSALRVNPGIEKLLPYAAVLDFYGEQLRIRSGHVVVPGGQQAESAWEHLVGANTHSPGDFVIALLSKDGGWLAPYYDALARVDGPQQGYFADPKRLPRFYQALRERGISPGPAKAVFRPDPGLLLLVTRMLLDSNGQPHVPGGLPIWDETIQANNSKFVRGWSKKVGHLNTPDDLIEMLFSLSREQTQKGPLQAYLALSEIDRARSGETPLSPATARLLASKYTKLGDQYPAFAEFHNLNDASLTEFINTAEAIDHIQDATTRGEATGIVQAQSGLWQILARQGEIPVADWNNSWQRIFHPFYSVHSSPELYDATRTSIAELMRAATGNTQATQDALIELVAGPKPTSPARAQIRGEIADRMRSVLEAQRLVSLNTLLALGDGLPQVAQGKAPAEPLVPLAEELREFEMPKPIFSTGEKIEWTSGHFGDSHTQAEMDTNIVEALHTPGAPKEMANARGRLVPFLRDFLVGLNYAYYEPPGAQMLHNNPLFIRRHDFSGDLARGSDPPWSTPELVGRGDTSGGGVRLTGGLADLAYSLGQVEQEFFVPRNVQSLIWEDLVPSLLNGAVLPRWWQITPRELHAVARYQQFGEDLLTSAGQDASLRQQVMPILASRMVSRRLCQLQKDLESGHPEVFLPHITPAETLYLGLEFQSQYPAQMTRWGKAGVEIQTLSQEDPEEINRQKLSEDFGVPHPALAQTNARELLNLRPFPTFLGYSSYLLAETWESNNLYWARLADEKGLPPESLHQLVPALTQRMVENIFATHLDDWPALLRALRETGKEFEEGKVQTLPKTTAQAQLGN